MPETRVTEGIFFTLSRFISNFFNPINSLFVYFVYFSIMNYHWKQAVSEFLPILLVLIIPLIAWIVWNVRKGNYSNMDVSNRIQRKSLYVAIIVLMLCYIIINYLIDKQIDFTMLFLFMLIFLMNFSNFFIKTSMHTAINVFAAALFFAENTLLGWSWLAIAVVVGISRVILKRHTPAEVFAGFLLAFIVSFAYLYTHNLLNG